MGFSLQNSLNILIVFYWSFIHNLAHFINAGFDYLFMELVNFPSSSLTDWSFMEKHGKFGFL